MKKLGTLFGALLLSISMFAASPVASFATTGDPYTYTVRIFDGNRGTVNAVNGWERGNGNYVEKTFSQGEECILPNAQAEGTVTISDEKYYARGYRESGKDYGTESNFNQVSYTSFAVNEDMDFVVNYNVRGEMVSYQVIYVDEASGEELGRSPVYWGNVGDQPVVAYEYIEGYQPRYRNITASNGLQPGTNEWRLPYVRITQPEGTTTTTTTEGGTTTTTVTTTTGGTTTTTGGTTGGGTTTTSTTTGGTTTGGTTGGTTTGNEGGNEDNTTTSTVPTETEPTEATPATPTTEEILDVDNPLAAPDSQDDDKKDDSSSSTSNQAQPQSRPTDEAQNSAPNRLPLIIGLVVAALIAAALAYYFLRVRPNYEYVDEDEEEEDEEA